MCNVWKDYMERVMNEENVFFIMWNEMQLKVQ